MVAGNHHSLAMLTELYIQALLVDEELADQVWEAWDKGEIDNQVAWLGWRQIVDVSPPYDITRLDLR